MKRCIVCGEIKELTEFGESSWHKSGINNACKECCNERYRKSAYKTKYGISIEDYEKMFDAQNGECAICHRPQSMFSQRFNVDHDHETGQIRALLCASCNRGIGYLQDDPQLVLNAYSYLTKHKKDSN